MKDVYLHIGAHRTGTSSFQHYLATNRRVLGEAGFDTAYPGRDGIATGNLRLRLPYPRHGRSAAQELIEYSRHNLAKRLDPERGGLILSEENIPGAMQQLFRNTFFGPAKRRFGALSRALPGPVKRVIYVIRPYEAFFLSCYRKWAETSEVPLFEDERERLVALELGWQDIVRHAQERLTPERLIVIDYGARGQNSDLLRHLLGEQTPEGLIERELVMNESASDAALLALQERHIDGEELSRAEINAVIEDSAGAGPARRLAAFTQAQSAALRARYAADLDAIDAMDGVTLIR